MKYLNYQYMTDKRISVYNWNHISERLTKDQIDELKSYYSTYHKKCWAYKKAMKRFKNMKFGGNVLSLLFATGGIASAIATGGLALVAVTSASPLIHLWMSHQSLDMKIQNCTYAYQSYNHLLIQIKDALRSGDFNRDELFNSMNNIDCYVTDNSPVIDKYLLKYNKSFISE